MALPLQHGAARNKCRFGQRTKLRSKERHSEQSISERSIGRSASERRVGAKTEPWKNGMNTCFRANANCPQLQTELRNGQSFGTKRASKQTAAVRCSECGQSQRTVRVSTAVQSQQVQPQCARDRNMCCCMSDVKLYELYLSCAPCCVLDEPVAHL